MIRSIKDNLIVILSAIVFIYSITKAQLNNPLEIAYIDAVQLLDTTIVMKPDADYQEYHIRVHIATKDSGAITIFRSHQFNGNYLIDTLNLICFYPEHNWYNPLMGFNAKYDDSLTFIKFVDINMDGFDDIFIMNGLEEVRDIEHYDIWLFNQNTRTFQISEEFTEKVDADNYDMDENKKTITTHWLNFRDPGVYGSSTYRINSNKLTLIERITQSFNNKNSGNTDGGYIWKQERLINGKLKVIKKITKTFDQIQKENE